MRGDYQTQMYCVSETNGELFELRMNEILKSIKNPDIRMDPVRSFTAYIFYEIQYNIPETITEAFELAEGERHHCIDCPACKISNDKRKKHHLCEVKGKNVHENKPVCIEYYKLRDAKDLLTGSDSSGENGPQDT